MDNVIAEFLDEQWQLDAMRSAVDTSVVAAAPVPGLSYRGFVVHRAPLGGAIALAVGHIDDRGKVAIDLVGRYASAAHAVSDLQLFGINTVAGAIVSVDFELDAVTCAMGNLITELRASRLH